MKFCLSFGAAPPAEAEDLDQRPGQIKAARHLPRQLPMVDEITFNIVHRLAARADQVMMGFQITFHQQGGRMRAHFPQQAVLDEQPQVVVYGCQRNRRSSPANLGKNSFHGMVTRCSYDGLINNLTLVRGRQPAFPGRVAKLFVSRWQSIVLGQESL
jgi:hypothetical protein